MTINYKKKGGGRLGRFKKYIITLNTSAPKAKTGIKGINYYRCFLLIKRKKKEKEATKA
jgi:hypothetical protein